MKVRLGCASVPRARDEGTGIEKPGPLSAVLVPPSPAFRNDPRALLARSDQWQRFQLSIGKWEDGPPDSEGGDPRAVGPAWLVDANGTERDINAGEWITRAEAEELAEGNGWTLSVDDADDPVEAELPLDVDAVNARLRQLGIAESQLVLRREEDPPAYVLVGSVADAAVSMFPLSPWETEESRQSIRHSFPTAAAVSARLDILARGWRER